MMVVVALNNNNIFYTLSHVDITPLATRVLLLPVWAFETIYLLSCEGTSDMDNSNDN